jgi:hypothetical protein
VNCEQPKDSNRGRWANVTCGVALVVLLGCCFAWYFEPLLKSRFFLGKDPLLLETLFELPDKTFSTTPGLPLSYLGYSFEVPWVDIDREKIVVRPNMVILPFRSGSVIWMSVYPPAKTLNILAKSSPNFCAIIGNRACESDYEFENLALRTTPDQLGWFKSRTHNKRVLFLLLIKTVTLTDSGGPEIFSVTSREFKGFQFRPASANGATMDDLYSDGGEVQLRFGRVTQPEINRIVQTLHHIRVDPTAAK